MNAEEKSKSAVVIIAGGGTGGHLYPGICLARRLRDMGIKTVFAVKNGDISIPILRDEGFAYFTLNIAGMPRAVSIRFIFFAFKALFSTIKSIFVMMKIKPDAVVGLGGYISFPAVFAAKILGIPSLIHEQNLIPGFANKILSYFADKIALSFPGSEKYWKTDKIIFTGNPVRPELQGISKEEAINKIRSMGSEAALSKDVFTVLVFGGSQGATAINTDIASCLEVFSAFKDKIQFIHISGDFDFGWVKKVYESRKYNAAVFPYIHKMGYAYAAADIVISRAGATTVAELIALKKPAILIPFAHAADNHQEYNARFLTERGAALLILEKDFECSKVSSILIDFIKNPSKLLDFSKSYEAITIDSSGNILAKIVNDLLY